MARTNIIATSGPVPWPQKGPEDKWKVEEYPNSGTRIWINTQGKKLCGYFQRKEYGASTHRPLDPRF
eukprot:8820670-Lingulodinium_polyedra.AAC.1